MYKIRHILPFALCFLILLSSCSQSNLNSKYISKDAVGILSINGTELTKKVAWSALSGSPFFKELASNVGSDTTKLDIEKTGIDPLNVFYIYGLPDQQLPSKSKFMAIIPLKNADKFKAFVKEKFPDAKMQSKDNLSFAILNQSICVGWNDKAAIFSGTAPSYNTDPAVLSVDVPSLLMDDIEKTFALKEDQSINSNPKFVALQKGNHDITYWINYEALINTMPQDQIGTAGAILASNKKFLKDIFIAGSLDFEKGKIVSDANYYCNPTMLAIGESMQPKSINNDLLKRVPGKQMNLMMSYHFNPKGIITMLDSLGQLPLVNSVVLKPYNLTMDDVTNAFTGDFLLAVTDFSVSSESKSYSMNGTSVNYTSPQPSFKASLSFKINDKTAFDKIMQLAVSNNIVTTSGPGVYNLGGSFATLVSNGEYAAVSNDSMVANAFLNPGNSNFEIPADVKNNPYGFYADIKNSGRNIPLDLLYGKQDTAVFHDGKNLLESISAYGGKVNGDHSDFHFEILFQNKDENSLMQLIEFSEKISEAEKKAANNINDVIPQNQGNNADTTMPI